MRSREEVLREFGIDDSDICIGEGCQNTYCQMADRIRELEARVPTGHTGSDAAPPREQKWNQGAYGFCPKCGAPGKLRERRPNGNDICESGHTYPSSTSRIIPLEAPRGEAVAWLLWDADGVVDSTFDKATAEQWAREASQLMVVRPLVFGDEAPVAAVVSEAMVEAYCEAKHGGWWSEMTDQQIEEERRDAHGLLTAALTAARGGA